MVRNSDGLAMSIGANDCRDASREDIHAHALQHTQLPIAGDQFLHRQQADPWLQLAKGSALDIPCA